MPRVPKKAVSNSKNGSIGGCAAIARAPSAWSLTSLWNPAPGGIALAIVTPSTPGIRRARSATAAKRIETFHSAPRGLGCSRFHAAASASASRATVSRASSPRVLTSMATRVTANDGASPVDAENDAPLWADKSSRAVAITSRALELLEWAVDHGFYPYRFFAEWCPFMEPLHAAPEFDRVVATAARRVAEFSASV